ncbi:type-F conjugative transfer system pilin assembly protein TrbC [Legionella quateirensis]|uniref:Conjugative transfer protein n=1 Tax=Legionella quateirensis TaxID=45072 RepID=A0A378KSW0_9GAMM|nr:type-F conjugative transfer system pilin assembly protein TrbC [Legionella quateirensis]KTD47798.1 conjugative transfer protein [Legionella quateirensis]STY16691.1 conjugative transfer protein [Legionella quateirensis]
MRKKGLGLLIGMAMTTLTYATNVSVFISFSMPDKLLEETLKDCMRLKIPAYLNGLHHNSMQETAIRVMELSQKIPDLNLQIDPTLFERFGIQQVPALVVENNNSFDVIYGHLSLKEGLMRIAGRGDSGLTVADVRRISGE